MKTLYRSTLGLIGALALAGATHAQVPSTNDISDGFSNTGMGMGALFHLVPGVPPSGGNVNTASGAFALYLNTTGYANTASGYEALEDNMTGCDNTASGAGALQYNTSASYNTASGAAALYFNTTGNYNTA
jgi:trimeric autotransporter adhesin